MFTKTCRVIFFCSFGAVLCMFISRRARGDPIGRIAAIRPRRPCARTSPREEIARRPISRVLSLPCGRGWPFIWDARYRTPRATDPGDDAGTRLPAEAGVPPLFGLAPGGVYLAATVAGSAVVSYTAVSPLPRISREIVRRYAFCCT